MPLRAWLTHFGPPGLEHHNAMKSTIHTNLSHGTLTRRQVLTRIGGGFGALALGSVFADAGLLAADSSASALPNGASNPLAVKPPHFPARAKRLIFLFMNGGPSHIDTFDPKPALEKYNG